MLVAVMYVRDVPMLVLYGSMRVRMAVAEQPRHEA